MSLGERLCQASWNQAQGIGEGKRAMGKEIYRGKFEEEGLRA
jgi:hypothetical protein